MPRWRRVDPWGTRQVIAGVAILFGGVALLLVSAAMVGGLVAGQLPARQAGSMIVGVAAIGACTSFWLRFHLVGIYHSERGLLIRYLNRSRLLPWPEVTGFDVRPTRLFGGTTRQLAAWMLTCDGAVETPVRARGPVRNLEKRSGPVLSATDFNLMMERLRRAHADAQAGGGVVVR